jgi:hypothetical protein
MVQRIGMDAEERDLTARRERFAAFGRVPMYDEDPALFLAGASGFGAAGAGGLAFTGAQTMFFAVVGITAIVVGLLLVRLAARSRDQAAGRP